MPAYPMSANWWRGKSGVQPPNTRLQMCRPGTRDGMAIRSREDERRGALPDVEGGVNLRDHLARGDDVLPFEVTAPLGKDLVLELDGARSGPFQQANGSLDVEGIAVARVGVHDEGNAY